ncbi:MAG TPA: MerR family transcriptional regulator [Actinomycetota bacterium]|nr:MerR family transcriptional regulator [Actinomycetota bacterium]
MAKGTPADGDGEHDPSLLKIGDVAERAGVSRRTVDFYTSRGLISPGGRTAGGYRLYEPDVVGRILLVRRLEEQGVSLDEIVAALGGKGGDAETQLRELDRNLHQLVRSVHGLTAAGGAEAQGLVSALARRIQGLVETAIEVTSGTPPPV